MGSAGPRLVLEMFRCGYDIVESAYPVVVTQLGLASTYWIGEESGSGGSESDGLWPVSVNVRSKDWEIDQRPIVEGCPCFACRNHTRGYISHLIHCKEILGEALLFVHNQQHLLSLCKTVRNQIRKQDRSLESFILEWEKTARSTRLTQPC